MKKFLYPSLSLLALIIGSAFSMQAGVLFYVPIPASESDPNSGISEENTYTTAVDGGNARGTDRVINGITFYAMTGEGQTLSANNCSLTVLEGTVANGGGASESIKADGTLSEVVSDMTFNNEANDGSEQEIVLDPESLTPGTTYDLRVYFSNSSGQNREVNLKFFGDGQAPVETGWFNEVDATTSPGGFKDPNQVYYVNYRYTWDGDTTPGITISQRYGRTPFCLYGLTNQVVPGEELGSKTASSGTEAEAAPADSGGLTAGFVSPSADEVGVTSDTFYSDETLNSNGDWVDVEGYGKCWRPTKVSAGWRPYTNGRWGECDDCGWTWISDEDFGWSTEHYGRWFQTEDTGWCWAPGTVWSPAWVSWRTGTGSDCDCVGWAPLPPEAGCQIDVGIGNWVDYTCGLGPEAYTFVNVVDFGADNFAQCGTCVMNRGSYVNIFEQTTNITNISYVNVNQTNQKYVNIYNGGPNPKWVNKELQKAGRKEMPQIHVNRYDDPTKIKGGKGSHLEGNTLSVHAPKITPTKNPQHAPKVAATIPKNKVNKGWAGIKDPKAKANLQNKIAEQTKGKTPKNAPAKLPGDVASRLAQKPITTGQVKGLPKGAVVPQPGTKGAAATQARVRPGERRQKGLAGQPGGAGGPKTGAADPTKGLAAPPTTQRGQAAKPGKSLGQQGRATTAGKAGASTQGGAAATTQGAGRQAGVRPGQSLKKTGRSPTSVAGQRGPQQRAPMQGAKGIQGKGAQQAQAQKSLQGSRVGGATGTERQGVAGPPAGQQKGQSSPQGKAQRPAVTEAAPGAQGPTQPTETKPSQAGQSRSQRQQAARKQKQEGQSQQQQAQGRQQTTQQAGGQRGSKRQRQAAQQQTQQLQQQQQPEERRQTAQQTGVQQGSKHQQRQRQQQQQLQQQAQQQPQAQRKEQAQRQQRQAAQAQQQQQQAQRQQQQAAQAQQQQQAQRQQRQAAQAQQQQTQQQQLARQQQLAQQQQLARQQQLAQQQQLARQRQAAQAQQQQQQQRGKKGQPTPFPRAF
jgi:hypothetical protein